MVLTLKPCTFTQADDTAYNYYLAVSSDKLLVLQRMDNYNDYELIDCIVEGKDNNGTLFSCPDEDSFLDAIIVIKDILLQGRNPLLEIECN
jgi:hypothetical protein